MATETYADSTEITVIPDEMVGRAFVSEFYQLLHHSPQVIYRFYKDDSTMRRPDATGSVVTVKTTDAINDLILSLDCTNFKVQILAAEIQTSLMDGITVLVTGFLSGLDNVRRMFVESFFLAPQQKGYYVLTDTFMFIDEANLLVTDSLAEHDEIVSAAPASIVAVVQNTAEVAVEEIVGTTTVEEIVETAAVKEIVETSTVEEIVETAAVKEIVETAAVNEIVETAAPPVAQHKSTKMVVAVPQEPAVKALPNGDVDSSRKKKTYAELLKDGKQFSEAFPVPKRAPAKPVRRVEVKSAPAPVPQIQVTTAPVATAAPKSAPAAVQQIQATTVPAATASAVNGSNGNSRSNGHASSNGHVAAKGHSIYIGHLPYDATPEIVEQEFKKFGPIRKNGVQVRSNQGYVFGFVEYEDASAQEKALETRTIQIGGKEVQIEEKKAIARGEGYTGRGGYRNDGYKRGNYSNGRGYARNDNGNNRNGEGPPRGRGNGDAYVNGGGKSARQGADPKSKTFVCE